MKKKISFLYFITFIISVNILLSYSEIQIDLTEDKKHSIATETKQILKGLNDVVFIKIYLDGDFPSEFKYLQSEVKRLLKAFKSIAGKKIKFQFVDPNNLTNEQEKMTLFKQLVKNGLAPTDIEIKTTNSASSQIVFPGALIYYKEKQHAINFLKNSISKRAGENINSSVENLEYEFITSIYNITKLKNDKIAFLEGNGELNSNEVYDITESVLKDNNKLKFHYTVERFNLKKFEIDSTTIKPNISKQVSLMSRYKLIIIAKPTIPFNNLDKFLIDQYIMRGGKILWMVDGVNASIDSLKNSNYFMAFKNNINIDDQFFKYGLRINSNIIQDLRSTSIPIVTGYSNNIPQQSFFKWPYFPLLKSKNNHLISKGLDAIKCEFASSIDTIQNSIKKTVLLSSSNQSRLNQAPTKVSLDILHNPPNEETYKKSELPIAILLEGEFESVFKNRILPKNNKVKFIDKSTKTQMIVISDGDIARNDVSSNGEIYPLGYDRYIKYTYDGNKRFIMNAIHYLCDDIGLTKLKSKEITLRLLDDNKIKKNIALIQIINIIFPLLFIVISTLILKYKKKRRYA